MVQDQRRAPGRAVGLAGPALSGDPRLGVFGEQLKDTNSPPPNATWLQVADVLGQQMEQVVKNGKDPAAALGEAQAVADSIGTGS